MDTRNGENEFTDVKNLSMLAVQTFDEILEKVKVSNLNFQVQMSPFSAIICLKKSFIRDRSGNIVPPGLNVAKYHENESLHTNSEP